MDALQLWSILSRTDNNEKILVIALYCSKKKGGNVDLFFKAIIQK